MKLLLGVALTAFACGADLLLGNMALSLSLCVYAALYLAGAYGRAFGWSAVLIGGLVLDAVCNRPFCITPLLYFVAESVGYFIAARMHFRFPETPLVSGGAAGVALCFGNDLAARLFGTTAPGPDWLSMLIFQMVFGMLFMLFLTALLDIAGRAAGLPLWEREVQERSSRSRRLISRSALRGSR